MDSTTTSSFVVKTLCQQIKSTLDFPTFESLKTDRGQVEYFLKNGKIRDQISSSVRKNIEIHNGKKDRVKGLKWKDEGNKRFGKGDNEGALGAYTRGVVLMDHSEKDLPLLYSNRSAALYHLSEFTLSLRDAEMALKTGYPKELLYKLYDRMARCYFCMDMKEKGKEFVKEAVGALAGLDDVKVKKVRKQLDDLGKSPPRGGFTNTSEKQDTTIPSIVNPSKHLKAASSRIELRYEATRGRFLITNEGFLPGDVIMVEKALVSSLYSEQYHRHCAECYGDLLAPLPCPTCIFASYCSLECKEKAEKSHHRYECGILGLLKNCGISVICYMGVRVVTKTPPPTPILTYYNLLNEIQKDQPGLNSPSTSIHSLFSLVTHDDKRRAEDRFHQVIMALWLLEALKVTSYVEECFQSVGSSMTELEVETRLAMVILRCLKALQFNTHEISAWTDNSIGIGGGLFPTAALCNHSCNPAVIRYFINDTIVIRAIRTIHPGEEVTENYGQNFATTPRSERQSILSHHYWFLCTCIACTQDWPTFETLKNEEFTGNHLKFRCPNCGTFICKADENMGILFRCGKCSQSVNVLKALKSLQESDGKYTRAVEFIDQGQVETGLGMILENLAMLEKYLQPPFKEYHMCQEHIRRCYLGKWGNRGCGLLDKFDPEDL